jgi:uncharacterized protein (DUF2141 family)
LKLGWLLGCVAFGFSQASASQVDITVTGIRSDRGSVVVAICDKANFPAGACPYHGHAAARLGEVEVHVAGVPPGTWAASVYHDEAGIGHVEFSLFGVPKQGFGFSRDARMRFGPPRFADAAFVLEEKTGSVTAPLHYPP